MSQPIEIKTVGDRLALLNIPALLTQEEAQSLLAKLGEVVDQDYAYHVGAVQNPLPYQEFKNKDKQLKRLLDKEPHRNPGRDLPLINNLCRQLGY